jgi:hypothetical protein
MPAACRLGGGDGFQFGEGRAQGMKVGPRLLLVGLVATVLVSPALAEDGTLVNPEGADVVVWKDRKARNEGLELMRTGVHRGRPEALRSLVACTVPVGTKVSLLDSGAMISHDIEVTSGEAAGCRGNVPADSFQRAK